MVRTLHIPADDQVFRTLLNQNKLVGSGFNGDIKIFTPKSPYIKGSGWFSRTAIPIFKKIIEPNLIDFGSKFLKDIASGKSVKSSAKKRGIQSLKKTVKKVLTGQGRRFKKKMSCHKPKTKHRRRKYSKKKTGGKKKKVKISKKKKNTNKRKTSSKKRKCIFDPNFPI